MFPKISTLVLLAANAAAFAAANVAPGEADANALQARHGPSQWHHSSSKSYHHGSKTHDGGDHHPTGPAVDPNNPWGPYNPEQTPNGGHHVKPGKNGGNPKTENWSPTGKPHKSKTWGPSQSYHRATSSKPHHDGESSEPCTDNLPTTTPIVSPPNDHGHHHGHKGHHGASQSYHKPSPKPSKSWHSNSSRPMIPKGHTSTVPTTSPWTTTEPCTEPTTMPTSSPNHETKTHKPSKHWPSASARARLSKEASDNMYALYGQAAAVVCGLPAQMPGAEITACPLESGTGWDCLNLASTLESCGGCQSLGEGQDCTAIVGAESVGCVHGKCVIGACEPGYYLDSDKGVCVAN